MFVRWTQLMKFNSVTYKGQHTAIPPGTGPSMRYACVTMCRLPAVFTADLSAMGTISGKNLLPALSIFSETNSLLYRSLNGKLRLPFSAFSPLCYMSGPCCSNVGWRYPPYKITILLIRVRETSCFIHWIEFYPVDSVIQQQGPVFVYNRADFSLMVVLNALVLCDYWIFWRGEGGWRGVAE